MSDLKEQHDRKIRELVRKYRTEGFEVLEEPTKSDLPMFLRSYGFRPDLIVKSPEESFVIEVVTMDSKEKLAHFAELADNVNKRKGWQFVMVMTNPRAQSLTPSDQQSLTVNELRDALGDFSALLSLSASNSNRFDDAALLKGWALVEAILRLGKSDKKVVSPRSMIRDGVMLGLISNKDSKFLRTVAEVRNKLAHGFLTQCVSLNMLKRLENTIEKLVNEAEQEYIKRTERSD